MDVTKTYVTWAEVKKFAEVVAGDFKYKRGKFGNSYMYGLYRGSLPIVTTVSNLLDNVQFGIIDLQTRDGKTKIIGENLFLRQRLPDIENIDMIYIVEDIIDSGKTIDQIIAYLLGYYDYSIQICIISMFGNQKTIDSLTEKYAGEKIIISYANPLNEGEWIVYPWEKSDKIDLNKNPLIESVSKTFTSCLDTLIKKNQDYTAGDSDLDPFKNFKQVELQGIASTEQGILVRLTDKMSRLTSLVKDHDLQVKSESIKDTIDDAINYLAILKAYIEQGEKDGI